MQAFVAFLRGINVGGNKKVPMADLKNVYEALGFKNVRTLLASGNVIFDSPASDLAALKKKIESAFEKKIGFTSNVILRPVTSLQKLAASDPFKDVTVTPDTLLYITFLSDPSPGSGQAPKSSLKIPYESPEKNFRILRVTPSEVISVLTRMPGIDTPKAMGILEKEFGKNMTTRNWNTVMKLVGL